jgi:HSP20 family protein
MRRPVLSVAINLTSDWKRFAGSFSTIRRSAAFLPAADIYETPNELKVILEMPGVDKSNVDVRVEDGVLTVEGRLDFSKYRELQPLYTEYNIGHYSRSFRLSTKIDQSKIGAEMKDGVLTLALPKVAEAKPLTVQVN